MILYDIALQGKTKMHLATTNSHLPPSCISSALSIIKDISVGIVNWLRIQRPGNFKLISEWGKKFSAFKRNSD